MSSPCLRLLSSLVVTWLSVVCCPVTVAQPAQAPAAGDVAGAPLRLGVIPRHRGAETLQMFSPLADYLGRALGRTVELEVSRDFQSFLDAVLARKFDIVHLNQLQYVRARGAAGYIAIARNEEVGEDTISSCLVVRRDSGITSVAQLRDKRVSFGGDRSAMMSYVLPTAVLRRAGLSEAAYQEVFTPNPPNALMAVYFGQSDAAGVGGSVLAMPQVTASLDVGQLRVLACSVSVPQLPWAVRDDMAPELRAAVQHTLTGLRASEEGRAILQHLGVTDLRAARDADYSDIEQLAAVVTAAAKTPSADKELVIGVFPRRGLQQTLRAFEPLAAWLSGALRRRVRVETTRDFPSYWRAVAEGRYDLMHYNQYHYLKGKVMYGHRVIARNEEFGRSSLAGGLLVRKDRGIKSVQDLKDQRIVFGGGRQAMIGYLVPTLLLRRAGLRPGDYVEEFAINPPNACMVTYVGQAAAGGVGDPVLELPVVKRKIDTRQLTFLALGEPLAHLPWAVNAHVSRALEARIQKVLLGLKDSEAGREVLREARLTALVLARDADYDSARRVVYEATGERLGGDTP